eukprot:3071614-Pyramimonas_sp.AAC.1
MSRPRVGNTSRRDSLSDSTGCPRRFMTSLCKASQTASAKRKTSWHDNLDGGALSRGLRVPRHPRSVGVRVT